MSESRSSGVHAEGTPSWHFTVVATAFTIGNVFSPYTLGAGGLLWGTVFWVYSSATTWISAILIGKCVVDGHKRGVDSTYPAMMEDAFGKGGRLFTIVMQIVAYYMIVIAMLVNFGNWSLLAWQIFAANYEWASGYALCLWQWILIAGALTVGLAQVRTFKSVIPLAIISIGSTMIRQAILYYQIWSYDLQQECNPSYGGVNFKSAITSLSTTALLYGGHGMFPEEIREMRRPESFFPALHMTYVTVIVVYISCAYSAYYVWGDWVSADIQFNYPANNATLLSAVLSAVWCIVEVTIVLVLLLGTIERTIIDPDVISARAWKAWNLRISGGFLRTCLRALIASSFVVVSVMLNSAGIGNIQALVGSVGMTALTYYAPFAVYWKLIASQGRDPVWKQSLYLLAFLSGVFVMLAGAYVSFDGIVESVSTSSLFDTSICNAQGVVDLASCKNPCRQAYGYVNSTCSHR